MRIKQYIVTYNNKFEINSCLDSIFSSLDDSELRILDVFVINNHSDIEINSEYLNKITILNNVLRPDFSTGHLSRNWNQSIINGFQNLINPDCNIVITNQDDTNFKKNYITKLLELHENFDFIHLGRGDQFISYTPNAIKKIGLWDERFCNIGYQEADYFLRASLYLKEKSSINDYHHGRLLNQIGEENDIIVNYHYSENSPMHTYHLDSMVHHPHSLNMFYTKWHNIHPQSNALHLVDSNYFSPMIPSFILYPYFEKDIETLDIQKFIYRF
jgi:hypothetical protein